MSYVRELQRNLISTLACAAVLAAPGVTRAQCLFEQPSDPSTGKVGVAEVRFVQAFVAVGNAASCEPIGASNAANTTTQLGAPGFTPPQTPNQLAGSPTNGWLFGDAPTFPSSIAARFKRVGTTPFCPGRDLKITVRLQNITDANGLAGGPGQLRTTMRATFNDPVTGDMTMVDLPVATLFTLAGGAATVTQYLGDFTVNAGLGCFPPACSSLEFVRMEILDENSNIFAVPGIQFGP